MSELLLKSIKSSTAVQKVNSVPMAKQVGVDLSLEACLPSRGLDYLIGSLFGYMVSLPGGEQEVLSAQTLLLCPEEDRSYQTLLDKYDSFRSAFTQDPDPFATNIL